MSFSRYLQRPQTWHINTSVQSRPFSSISLLFSDPLSVNVDWYFCQWPSEEPSSGARSAFCLRGCKKSPPWHLLKLAVFKDSASGSPPHTVLPNYGEGINLQFYLLDLCRCGQICQAWINCFFLCLGSLYPCQSGWYLFPGRGKLIFIRWKGLCCASLISISA